MFPTLVALYHTVRDILQLSQLQKQQQEVQDDNDNKMNNTNCRNEEEKKKSFTFTPTIITVAAGDLVARLLNGIEEALTPDPLFNAGVFFTEVVRPLLNRAPRQHKTHFPLEETLRSHRPDTVDAFRCWIIHSLNAVDSLRESLILLLLPSPSVESAVGVTRTNSKCKSKDRVTTETLVTSTSEINPGNKEDVWFRKEQARRLEQYLGPHSYLRRTEYVSQLLNLLHAVWHPESSIYTQKEVKRHTRTADVVIQYELSLMEALPLFCDMPRVVHVEQLKLRYRRRSRRAKTTHQGEGSRSMGVTQKEEETTVGSPSLWTHTNAAVNGHDNNGSVNESEGEYLYVVDVSTQTVDDMGCQNTHKQQSNSNSSVFISSGWSSSSFSCCCSGSDATIAVESSRATDSGGTPLNGRMMVIREDMNRMHIIGKASTHSIAVNTMPPSSLMSFVELLDAQEELEKARSALRREEAALQLREQSLTESEHDYRERLDLLTHVLRGVKKVYNEFVPLPHTDELRRGDVESRLLNLVEVIYSTTNKTKATRGEDDESTEETALPIPFTPEMRAVANKTIARYQEERQRRLRMRQTHTVAASIPLAVADDVSLSLPVLFPPTVLPRPLQLQQQAYRCPDCRNPLTGADSRFFRFDKKPRRCHYCTQIFCHTCHTNRVAVLPFLVLTNWDFTARHVCGRHYEWLQRNWNQPCCTVGGREEQQQRHREEQEREEGQAQCPPPVSTRDAIVLVRVLRHWFLVCARMLRCCTEAVSPELTATLQTYYAETDAVYSLSDLRGVKYSEEGGIVAQELRGNKTWLPLLDIPNNSYSNSLFVDSLHLMATVGSVVSAAVPYQRALRCLRGTLNTEKSRFVPLAYATWKEAGEEEEGDREARECDDSYSYPHCYPLSSGISTHVSSPASSSFATAGETTTSITASPTTTVATRMTGRNGHTTRDDEKERDFVRYLVTQIQAMERHLLRDCSFCVARATTVCELCGDRTGGARLPLIDAEVFGVQLLEKATRTTPPSSLSLSSKGNNTADADRKAQLILIASAAVYLVRGCSNRDTKGRSVAACRRCGVRYHRLCKETMNCPHCT